MRRRRSRSPALIKPSPWGSPRKGATVLRAQDCIGEDAFCSSVEGDDKPQNAACPGVCVRTGLFDCDEICPQNQRCDVSTGECGPLAGSGEVCAFSEDCQEGLRCEFDPDTSMSQCVAPSGVGESCQFSEDCAAGLSCQGEFTAMTCQVALTLGEACAIGECAPELYCFTDSEGESRLRRSPRRGRGVPGLRRLHQRFGPAISRTTAI